MNIISEDLLVTKLDKYVVKNKIYDLEIMQKLKSAVESIPILIVEGEVINKIMDEDLKKTLLKQILKAMHSLNVHRHVVDQMS